MMSTCFVRWSSQAIRIRSAVAGEFNGKNPLSPFSALANAIAFFMAKNTLDAKNNGGSPTALDE